MQQRAALWITRAFCTSPSEGIEAIAGLTPIYLYLQKLNGHHHLHYASIPPSHAINSLLDLAHAKNQSAHKFATSNLTNKQQTNLKSPIKDVNEHLNEIFLCFNPTHILFSPGSRVVDHFSSRIVFYSPLLSSNKDTQIHIQNLNHAFRQLQDSPHSTAIIADGGVKKSNVTSAVAHTWSNNSIINQFCTQTINIISIEAELMFICIGLILAINNKDTHQILVITDAISVAKKILESQSNPLQKSILSIADNMNSFFSRDNRNVIHFWQCPNKAEWPRHKLVDDQVKAAENRPIYPSRNSYLFSRKKECNNALKE